MQTLLSTWLLIFVSAPLGLFAQTSDPSTRWEAIENLRRQKPAAATDEDKVELLFDRVQTILDNITSSKAGFGPIIGGLPPGGGFAAGPQYDRPDLLNGNLHFRVAARASIRMYEKLDAELKLPHLANDRAFLSLYGAYENYPTIQYYGPGPESTKSGRSDFRLEQSFADLRFGVRPARRFTAGLTGGYLMVNVGPGTNDRFVSSEQIYPPSVAVGIDRQSNFLRGGPFLEFDSRDQPLNPHKGGNYTASYIYYDDRKLDISNHRKLSAEAQQYFPFFNEKRVIALRAKTELSYRNTNQVVPFYLQPNLGGANDLRGFRPFRFYDNNMMVMTGEYRWEVMTGFDMAVFADAGKVFHRHAQLNFADLETDGGIGLRFKSRSAVFMRWDVGFSREGFQIWIAFNNIF